MPSSSAPPRRVRWRQGFWLEAVDIAAGAAVVAICLMVIVEPPDPGAPEFDGPLRWGAILIALGIGVPIAIRRRLPVAALAVALPATMAADVTSLVSGASGLAAYVLYMVALARPVRVSAPLLAACMASPFAVLALTPLVEVHDVPSQYGFLHVLIGLALFAAAWALGHDIRRGRERAAEAEAQLARQALVEERLRIARELHDMVARGLSLITVKAAVAAHVARHRPDEALSALPVIEQAARDALAEVRQLLGMLRPDEAPDFTAPRTPGPGLADLPRLAEQAESDGVRVVLDDHGLPELPAALELTVYRIVQEAITNAVKHAAPAECRVRLRFEDGRIAIEVADDGPGAAAGPGGHGLLGMRERVAMYGGSLSAADGHDGGFVVKASIPFRPRNHGEAA
jgi:signal transduction histidine kinase